ncbi:STAS domain-containing protein [Marinobacter sp. chi1]|uniref:STAS domain-containing protein n=1 Tax=Marinobacter suaedae TaxID=3057675 RepID=A0ABT8VWK2_9GAMM|nr:STAS domain-containing protein [Marinobacter sp. chi1]MDO3720363.1 STAS domain-containing protein [Marinobacter sp. chi1]
MSLAVPSVTLNGTTLSVAGEVNAETVMSLRSRGEALIRSARSPLAVDLAGLEAAHSVVLSMLLCWQRAAGESGATLTFQNASDRLRSLAALSNLDRQIPGFETA